MFQQPPPSSTVSALLLSELVERSGTGGLPSIEVYPTTPVNVTVRCNSIREKLSTEMQTVLPDQTLG